MMAPGCRRDPRCVLVSLALAAGLVTAGCGGTRPQAPASATSGTATAVSTPAVSTPAVSTPAQSPPSRSASRWDAPGSSTLSQALAVTRRYAAALHAERVPGAGLYASDATFDYWASGGLHDVGASSIEGEYRGARSALDWSKQTHLMVAPGVGVCESTCANISSFMSQPPRTPYLSLLAVTGDKIVHEEIFLDTGSLPPKKAPVKFWGSAPGPRDTARAAAAAGAAVGRAFANGDPSALRAVVAPDVLFCDTAQAHGWKGVDAVLHWWANVPDVQLRNEEPVAGAGWVVDRWTVRQVLATGEEKTMPGATVMEVRGGKVVRMTLYYESLDIPLQMRGGGKVVQ